MKNRNREGRIAVLILLFMISAACGTMPQIAANVDYFCRPAIDGIHTYRIEFEDVPEFLKPMLRDSASIVLDTKDMAYTEGDADSVLTMTYFDRSVSGPEAARNEAWETIAPGGGVRFIAEIKVDLRTSVANDRILSGSMRRIHNVYEGSYMHDEPAKAAMRVAFAEIFADCPIPSVEQP